MMFYYYDIKSENLFEALFKDTYIYNNTTPNKNNYYVIKFDFSGMDTAGLNIEEIKEKFASCVIDGINRFINYYEIDYEINYNNDADVIIKYFLNELSTLDHKIYIIIDEYDNFTNAMLEGDTKRFNSIVGNEGILKAFYAVIKTYIGLGVVDRFFATGICPVTLNSMTTGFNIAVDKSTHKDFNTMIGLTHEEVLNLLDELELSKEEKENLYKVMLENYNGYMFSDELKEDKRIFNATLVMYFLKEYITNKEIPKKLYDNNIVVNYGKIDNLIKLQNNNFYKELINEILETSEITGTLKTQFNLIEEFTRDDIISLLYYFGYLTIKNEDIIGNLVFKIPNQIMKETYSNYFLKLLRDNDIQIDNTIINNTIINNCLYEIILEGKIDTITNYVSNNLKLASNRLFKGINEYSIELLYFSLLKSEKLKIFTELECSGGNVDIYVEGKKEPLKHNILIELKYIKKNDYNENLLESKREEAIKQINQYSTDTKIKSDNLKKYVVIFSGEEVKLLEEIK